jgi:hypothetical protein
MAQMFVSVNTKLENSRCLVPSPKAEASRQQNRPEVSCRAYFAF